MKYYRIAQLNVAVDGIDGFAYVKERFSDYETSAFSCADVTVKLEDVDFIPIPRHRPLASSYMLRRFYKDSDSYGIYVVEDEGNGAVAQIHSNLTWSELTVKTSSIHITGVKNDLLAFQVLWDAFRNIFAFKGGIVLHSSAISYDDQGILFSAPSGTGKSTHTRLWKKLYPEKVEIVNDDTPVIFFRDDVPYMYGIPWSGKGYNKNTSVFLKAIVFLMRSRQNVINSIDIDSAVFYLLEQIYRPVFLNNLDTVLNLAEKLLKCTELYSIGVNMEDSAAEMVKNTVFPEQ